MEQVLVLVPCHYRIYIVDDRICRVIMECRPLPCPQSLLVLLVIVVLLAFEVLYYLHYLHEVVVRYRLVNLLPQELHLILELVEIVVIREFTITEIGKSYYQSEYDGAEQPTRHIEYSPHQFLVVDGF